MDRADEASTMAQFLKRNQRAIFNSNKSSVLIKFWDLLMDLLINVDQESSKVCCDIVFSINKLNTNSKSRFSLYKISEI